MIRFHFSLEKAILAMSYVVHSLGSVEKVKLTKLIYLADCDHFLKVGRPITGDRLCAMPYGPVPSNCLDALNGLLSDGSQDLFHHLQIVNNDVMIHSLPDFDELEVSEREVLDHTMKLHGRKPRWSLVQETHELPEFKETYREGTSTTIPYEIILKHHGSHNQFRHDRPVVTSEMMSHMLCPFPSPDPDL